MISKEQAEFNAIAAARYMAALSPVARAYLNGRGISDDTIAKFKLGEVDGSFPEHGDYEGRISVPYITRLGGVQGFKFRRVGDDPNGGSKYLTNHMPTRLYNSLAFERAEQAGYIAICEGESDTWTVDGECGIPAVGVPGVDTWKSHPEWRLLFDGFRKVLFFGDQDDAGDKLKAQVLRDIEQAYAVQVTGKDVNESYLKHGRDAIRAAAGV
jgi:DNA primase